MTPASETQVQTPDGLRLALRHHHPSNSRALVVLTHGHGEHGERYPHVVAALNQRNLAVTTWDLRGHGHSDGPRGHVPRYDSYLDDLQWVRESAVKASGPLPLFLLGHSLGGQITLAYALACQGEGIRGVVVNAPVLRMKFAPPPWKIILAKLLTRLAPRFTQDTGLPDAGLSHDAAFLASLPGQALRHRLMSARLGMEMLSRGSLLLESAGQIRTPIFITHGELDPIIDAEGSRMFHERCASPDKTLRIFPGQLHETHNDSARVEVVDAWADWIKQRLGS